MGAGIQLYLPEDEENPTHDAGDTQGLQGYSNVFSNAEKKMHDL
jgi:hypothetical protein